MAGSSFPAAPPLRFREHHRPTLLSGDFRAEDVANLQCLQRRPRAEEALANERLQRKIRPAKYVGSAGAGIGVCNVLGVATDRILEVTVIGVADAADRGLEKLTNVAFVQCR